MVDQEAGRKRAVRWNTVLATLLLTAPLAALAGCAASPARFVAERNSAAPVTASASELPGFELESPRVHVFLLATPFQVLVSDDQLNAELMPVIEVQATELVLPQTRRRQFLRWYQ